MNEMELNVVDLNLLKLVLDVSGKVILVIGIILGFGWCFVYVFVYVGVKVVIIGWCVDCFEDVGNEIKFIGGIYLVYVFDVMDVESICWVMLEV